MSSPVAFNARALGEEILRRTAEIEYLRSEQRAEEIRVAGRGWNDSTFIDADEKKIARLSQHLDLYSHLAETAAQAERNDILTAQHTDTAAVARCRVEADEF